jgi:hypothetical protein
VITKPLTFCTGRFSSFFRLVVILIVVEAAVYYELPILDWSKIDFFPQDSKRQRRADLLLSPWKSNSVRYVTLGARQRSGRPDHP